MMAIQSTLAHAASSSSMYRVVVMLIRHHAMTWYDTMIRTYVQSSNSSRW